MAHFALYKKLNSSFTSAICLLLVSALNSCNGTSNDSVKQANKLNMQRDSNQNTAPLTPDKEISGLDAKFAVKAAAGGLAEIELGKLALKKSKNRLITDIAVRMIKDHGEAYTELKLIADERHIYLPKRISNDGEQLTRNLASENGFDFDKSYIKAMIKEHQDDISDFDDARKIVRYPEMSSYIKNTLPMLKTHLKAIQKIDFQINNKHVS